MGRPVEKYLDRYAEPEAEYVTGIDFPIYDHALVIPACREQPADVESVWRQFSDKLLVILVVNSSREDDEETTPLLDHIHRACPPIEQRENLSLHGTGSGRPDILLIDRCTAGRAIPAKQGVGLARKIGADITLRLIVDDVIGTPIIFSTDADVELPTDYFQAADIRTDTAATLYPFRHKPDPGLELPTTLYEISMLYYVAGLEWAGSPWAFTSIGSTIAVCSDHYAMVRGFPKRAAGEDFYLLNKLAKTGRIRQLPGPFITIAARPSTRVPFGTGTNLARIAALDDPAATFTFYHPQVFRELATWLEMLNAMWDQREYLSESPHLDSWCEETGFLQLAEEGKRRFQSRESFTRFLHQWFDAFRTLKFIHFMRDRVYPSVPIDQIADTEFTPQLDSLPRFRDQLASICFEEPQALDTW